jgi:hypothetical protein
MLTVKVQVLGLSDGNESNTLAAHLLRTQIGAGEPACRGTLWDAVEMFNSNFR